MLSPEPSLPGWDPFANIRVFPLKGFGGFLMEADLAEDLAFQIGNGGKDTAIDDLTLKLAEPAFDLRVR